MSYGIFLGVCWNRVAEKHQNMALSNELVNSKLVTTQAD